MEGVYFIDREGNVIHSDGIESHIGLANLIIEQNPNLKEEFEKSGQQDPVDFLVEHKGYMKVRNNGYYRRGITFDSQKLSDVQRKAIRNYHEEGYKMDDVALIRIRQKRDSGYRR